MMFPNFVKIRLHEARALKRISAGNASFVSTTPFDDQECRSEVLKEEEIVHALRDAG
jgi:hypothetical protein